MVKQWLPLESNPEVMVPYSTALGAQAGAFDIVDVWGTDPDVLTMVPQPVRAVMMLYPITDKTEAFVEALDAANRAAAEAPAATTAPAPKAADATAEGGIAPRAGVALPPSLFFMKQFVSNACGTIGLMHALANTAAHIPLTAEAPTADDNNTAPKGSFLGRFVAAGAALNADERGRLLETMDELDSLHELAAVGGQSDLPSDLNDVNLHFVTFVHADGYLWELDGRRSMPQCWGPCAGDGEPLLQGACQAMQHYVRLEPDNLHFAFTALVTPQSPAQ